jgi:predicted ABC-type ATPase
MKRILGVYASYVKRKFPVCALPATSPRRARPPWVRYQVSLYFLQLPTADMAIERVQLRVSKSGHNIPDAVVRRRFDAELNQFEITYNPIVNAWFLYNNQHPQPTLLAQGANP